MAYLYFLIECSEYNKNLYDKNSEYNKILCLRQETNFFNWEFDLEYMLRSKKHEIHYEPSYDDLVDYECFLDKISLPESFNDEYTAFYITHINSNAINRAQMFYTEFENYIGLFYKLLIQYIKSYVTSCSHKTYFTRIDKITETIYMCQKYKYFNISKNLFNYKIQKEFKRVLNTIFLKFKENSLLTKKNYNHFA